METCCSDGFSCVPLVYPFCKKGFFYVDFALATCCIKFSWFELACLVVGMTGNFQCRIVCTALASCSRNNANITNIRFVCTHQFAYSPCNRRTNERTCDSFTSLDMSNSVYQSLQCTCQALFEPAQEIVKSLRVHTNIVHVSCVFVLVDKQHPGLIQLLVYILDSQRCQVRQQDIFFLPNLTTLQMQHFGKLLLLNNCAIITTLHFILSRFANFAGCGY